MTCTGAPEAIINEELYRSLLNGEDDKKVIVDLAIPNDIDAEVVAKYPTHYIEVSQFTANRRERTSKSVILNWTALKRSSNEISKNSFRYSSNGVWKLP